MKLGWYHIDEVWNLYIDGTLQKVHVDYINVDETTDDEDDRFHVDHYTRDGELVTSLLLDMDDLEPELSDREPTDRPMRI